MSYTKRIPQLNIYLKSDMYEKIQSIVQQSDLSMSSWVASKLESALKDAWPESFLKTLGSMKNTKLKRPSQGKLPKAKLLE